MTRTSLTHPLQIAVVHPGPALGRIGITFCPGKHQPTSATGSWARDLTLDVRAIADWGAAAVLTLVEDHELTALKVEGLGAAVEARSQGPAFIVKGSSQEAEDSAVVPPEEESPGSSCEAGGCRREDRASDRQAPRWARVSR